MIPPGSSDSSTVSLRRLVLLTVLSFVVAGVIVVAMALAEDDRDRPSARHHQLVGQVSP
jgi:hypothetical protein